VAEALNPFVGPRLVAGHRAVGETLVDGLGVLLAVLLGREIECPRHRFGVDAAAEV